MSSRLRVLPMLTCDSLLCLTLHPRDIPKAFSTVPTSSLGALRGSEPHGLCSESLSFGVKRDNHQTRDLHTLSPQVAQHEWVLAVLLVL